MSFTTVIIPMIAALLAPEGKFLEHNSIWQAFNSKQEYFLKNCYSDSIKQELKHFDSKELRSWASQDHNELNRIAKENGFNIKFSPFTGPDEFGSLSILDVGIKWLNAGTKTTIKYQDKAYKAAQLISGFKVFESTGYQYAICQIQTQSKDTVYMTIADEKLDGFDLIEKIKFLKAEIAKANSLSCDKLIFPCVELDQQVNISWFTDMKSGDYFIKQALQQTKFKMDETGARVQSIVGFGFMTSSRRDSNKIVIDRPFYIWIERENCVIPVFAGYIDPSNWLLSYN